jgi:hypothetical protein
VAIANKQVPTALNKHRTTEEMLEEVFSMGRVTIVATQWRGKHVSAAKVELQ